MGRGKQLTDIEKGKIIAYHEVGESLRSIERKIGRSRGVITNYLANNDQYGSKYKCCGRKSNISPRTKRKIANEASNSTISVEKIRKQLNLDVSRTTVWRSLKENSNIKRSTMNFCPFLKPKHEIARLNFGKVNMNTDWTKVTF